jgi:Flp pilus assembly pilin Flp
MKLFKLANRFSKDESGAVTVDWVVLTAAIVGLATAIVLLVRGGANDLAGEISSGLAGIAVETD